MSTIIRYTGHPEGWIDFYMGEELIYCQNSVTSISAQQLWNACQDVEDEQLAEGFLEIAVAEGKTAFIQSPLTVTLLRGWTLDKEGAGSLTVSGGNVINENNGTNIFATNPNVSFSNFLATAEKVEVDAIADAVWQYIIEAGLTAAEVARIDLAASAGKASGAETTEMRFRSVADDKDRITATVDQYGNREAITLDGT